MGYNLTTLLCYKVHTRKNTGEHLWVPGRWMDVIG